MSEKPSIWQHRGTLPIRFRMNGTMSGTAGELAAYQIRSRQRALVGEFRLSANVGKPGSMARPIALLRQEGGTVHWCAMMG